MFNSLRKNSEKPYRGGIHPPPLERPRVNFKMSPSETVYLSFSSIEPFTVARACWVIRTRILNSPPSCPDYPACPHNRKGSICISKRYRQMNVFCLTVVFSHHKNKGWDHCCFSLLLPFSLVGVILELNYRPKLETTIAINNGTSANI